LTKDKLTCSCIIFSGTLHRVRCSRTMNLSQTLNQWYIWNKRVGSLSIHVYKLSLLYACNKSKLPLNDVYHILIILLRFLHWVIDYQLTFSKIDDYEYPVKVVHRDMSHRLGLSKIKGVHLHVNYIYIYNSLEVVGEEYFFLSFWFTKNLIRFIHMSLIQVAEGFGSLKWCKDQQIQEYCPFWICAQSFGACI